MSILYESTMACVWKAYLGGVIWRYTVVVVPASEAEWFAGSVYPCRCHFERPRLQWHLILPSGFWKPLILTVALYGETRSFPRFLIYYLASVTYLGVVVATAVCHYWVPFLKSKAGIQQRNTLPACHQINVSQYLYYLWFHAFHRVIQPMSNENQFSILVLFIIDR